MGYPIPSRRKILKHQFNSYRRSPESPDISAFLYGLIIPAIDYILATHYVFVDINPNYPT